MPNFISKDQIERALVQKLQHLHGFDSLDCHTEDPEDLNDGSGRANKRDVILVDRVREAATRLNPRIPPRRLMTRWKSYSTGVRPCRSSPPIRRFTTCCATAFRWSSTTPKVSRKRNAFT